MSKKVPGKMQTSFTVQTGSQGFTDQMMQFAAFYKLGLALEYQYVFTPFLSVRSRPLGTGRVNSIERLKDIYDFLGFNQHFDTPRFQLDSDNVENIEVELSDNIVEINNIGSLEELKQYVKSYIDEVRKTEKTSNITFRLERKKPAPGKGKRQFFSLIHSGIPSFQDGLNFREIYFNARKKEPVTSYFENHKIKTVIHIRQGDTGVVETPWNTIIPVDSRRPDFLTEQVDHKKVKLSFSNNAVDSVFDPVEYYNFLIKLYSYFYEDLFSPLIFSDGYQRAFNIIQKNINRLALDEEKKAALRNQRKNYDKQKFSAFSNLKSQKCFVGETEDNLHALIHSTLCADLVIVAAQQRMLPKLAANYCVNNKPIIIVLYRKSRPDYSDVIINDDERYIYTDIDNPDFEQIIYRLKQLENSIIAERTHF